jgi:hypothetical protein
MVLRAAYLTENLFGHATDRSESFEKGSCLDLVRDSLQQQERSGNVLSLVTPQRRRECPVSPATFRNDSPPSSAPSISSRLPWRQIVHVCGITPC